MKYLILIGSFIFLSISCNKESNSGLACEDAAINCTGVTCLIQQNLFDFRIVDKSSGVDLVFGGNPRYATADIKVYSDASLTTEIPVTADTPNKQFQILQAKSQMYLVVAAATTYTLSADFRKLDCCTNRIKNLRSDGQSVCVCCDDIISIKVN